MLLGFPRTWTQRTFLDSVHRTYTPSLLSLFPLLFIFILSSGCAAAMPGQSASAVTSGSPTGITTGNAAGSSAITVSITPTSASLVSLATFQFTAIVSNTTNTGVTWKATAGTISTSGLFTAPWVTSNTTSVVTATSKADTTKSASVTVNLSPIPALVITTASLPNTLTGASYSQTLAATGGTPPYSWKITIGALPTGITLSSSGKISGSTSETGAFTFTARVDDSGKYQKNAHQSYTINVNLNQSGVTVPSNFFNMHMDLSGTPWPSSPIAGQRFWDSGVTWALINTAKGVYDWTTLDQKLSAAKSHSVDVLYTLSSTPVWAQCTATTSSPCVQTSGCANDTTTWGGGPGQCYWPGDLNADGTGTNQHWKDWVTAVATHSVNSTTAHIKYYEVLNEPNVNEFWRGTTAQLVRMAQDAACIIKGVGPNCTNTPIDKNALILSPSPALGGDAINSSLSDFFSQGGAQVTDVIAFHGYNGTNDSKIPTLVSKVRDGAQTTYNLLSKPLYDTEFSWGANVYFPDPDEQAGFVARSMLLHWSSGVSRVYWYAWDTAGTMWSQNSVTGCTTPDASGDGFSCTTALAFTQVQNWMVGATLNQSCSANGTVWTCGFTKSGGFQGLAVWDTSQSCSNGVCTTSTYKFTPVSPNYFHYLDLAGKSHTISGTTVPIGYKPIFLENQ
jgi:polysaccharide biosynthesis protein PslG